MGLYEFKLLWLDDLNTDHLCVLCVVCFVAMLCCVQCGVCCVLHAASCVPCAGAMCYVCYALCAVSMCCVIGETGVWDFLTLNARLGQAKWFQLVCLWFEKCPRLPGGKMNRQQKYEKLNGAGCAPLKLSTEFLCVGVPKINLK